MTDDYFFDTDCLSAFLWVHSESILSYLYARHIILPAQVYNELKRVPHLLARVNSLKNNGDLTVKSIEADSTEYHDYLQMTTAPEAGFRIIGNGEAAAIAMVKKYGGIIASNNMRDISPYIAKYELRHITTGDILIKALNSGIITEVEGNTLWSSMLRKKRMLPSVTFSDYIKSKQIP